MACEVSRPVVACAALLAPSIQCCSRGPPVFLPDRRRRRSGVASPEQGQRPRVRHTNGELEPVARSVPIAGFQRYLGHSTIDFGDEALDRSVCPWAFGQKRRGNSARLLQPSGIQTGLRETEDLITQ